ncbi:MerR family transcriptional regulator [Actinocrinis puniceicyclus]|uniref:MerR family transcriptional regulator n=1 Tax=Actinocrinis puniceicyclus TaxID=977794 RepID=A0A8J7WP41_9ACTN|nr:MerR family transcriptional regulator [Actinocrinis puniceicyclus]MBS2964280.1 MerR family transcriptional regulator [Actinocrinis puniceicyclus]
MNESELYSIGDVARRTGLSVSAIRYYADEGVVAPTGVTDGGFRQYDVHAIAQLELVRTLRELGAGLGEIRRVLTAQATLHDLAVTHLRLVEGQLGQLRARRAVLRAVVRQNTTTEHVSLLHKLVSMSDDERDRLINQFWDFVTDGLDVHPGYVERLHNQRPHLPEEPSSEQLEAWIELAEIVQDEEFRAALRDFFRRGVGSEKGKLLASPEMMARVEQHLKLRSEARASQQAGVAADSPQARDIAERVAADSAELVAAMTGKHDLDKARRGIAEFDRSEKEPQWLAKAPGLKLLTRYLRLVATINGTPKPDPDRAAAIREWMAAALRSQA